jgi:hypothetical protein
MRRLQEERPEISCRRFSLAVSMQLFAAVEVAKESSEKVR